MMISTSELKVRTALTDRNKSNVRRYQELVIGKTGLWDLVKYEMIVTLFSWLPGALGILLRNTFYPLLLGRVGKNVTFGRNITLRHPHKISIGDNVMIDDNCLLDAKGTTNTGITIDSSVFIGRNTIISCKNGDIHLKDGVNIGFNCDVYSSGTVSVGPNTLLGAYTYLVGGGNYDINRFDITFAEQEGLDSKGGIHVHGNTWLGGNVKVLDGVTIGYGSVVGAGAVVAESIPEYQIAAGVPARIVRARRPQPAANEGQKE
jgi:acetyltransferase-like isoleucine patch superfamily enzyme